jgi:PhnB protein
MMKDVMTYLNFDGNCGEAMKFYERCLGGDLYIMPFSETPCDAPLDAKGRIAHASVLKNGKPLLMASDTLPGMAFREGNNFSVMLQCESAEEVERLFTAFGEGGEVTMAVQDTFWGARFGMVLDRFGINWMFNFEKPKQ